MTVTLMPKPTAKREATASPREVARYLGQLRPLLLTVMHDRQEWLRLVGMLIEEARTGTRPAIAQHAGRIGRDQIGSFAESRLQLDGLQVPATCQECHAAVARWLDTLTASCEVLIDVGFTGRLERIKQTQALLAEGRAHARQFNRAQAELIADLRARLKRAA